MFIYFIYIPSLIIEVEVLYTSPRDIFTIKVKEVPVKVHNSIRKVKRYYMLLHRIYKIIYLKLKGVSKELTL